MRRIDAAIRILLPLVLACGLAARADSTRPWARRNVAIVVYDGCPGGAGVAELGFGAADRHLAATLDVLEGCRCADGCPSCVQSPKCGNWNEPLDKAGAISLLRTAL